MLLILYRQNVIRRPNPAMMLCVFMMSTLVSSFARRVVDEKMVRIDIIVRRRTMIQITLSPSMLFIMFVRLQRGLLLLSVFFMIL